MSCHVTILLPACPSNATLPLPILILLASEVPKRAPLNGNICICARISTSLQHLSIPSFFADNTNCLLVGSVST